MKNSQKIANYAITKLTGFNQFQQVEAIQQNIINYKLAAAILN